MLEIQYSGMLYPNFLQWTSALSYCPLRVGSIATYTTSVATIHSTHWGRDQMDDISQTTFSNAFSWMKMSEFRLKFCWSLYLMVKSTIPQHWLRYWLGADQATSHHLNQWCLVYWRIYASLGLNELTACRWDDLISLAPIKVVAKLQWTMAADADDSKSQGINGHWIDLVLLHILVSARRLVFECQ